MSEADLRVQVLRELSRGQVRLFRTNVALAWQGTVIESTPSRLVLLNPRPVKVGVKGQSDLCGWSAGCIYTAIELKTGRLQATTEQKAFIDLVVSQGGRAGIARSVEDAARILGV